LKPSLHLGHGIAHIVPSDDVANCAVERGFRDEIRRVRKIDERKPIDAVPAMALAVWRATQAETSDIPLATFI